MDNWFKIYRDLLESELWLRDPFSRAQAWVDLIGLANHKNGFIRIRGNRVEINRGQVGWSLQKLAHRWKWSRGKVVRFFKELENDHQIEQQKNNISSLITIINYEKYQSKRTADGQQTDSRAKIASTSVNNEDSDENQLNMTLFPSVNKLYFDEKNGHQNDEQKDNENMLKLNNNYKSKTNQQTAERTADGQQTDSRRTADGQQTDTNKEEKEYKKNIISNEIIQKKDSDTKNFKKPSVQEIRDYCIERKNRIDPEMFFDFYEMKDWFIGKNKMKDWKAAIRTWERRSSGTNNNTQKNDEYSQMKNMI